jgi:nicotinate phosphoribosyltransferase
MAYENIKKHYFLPEDHHLFDYDQIFAVSSMWVELGMEDVVATYDLYVRDMPKNRNFMMFGGLEEIVENMLDWHFTSDEVDYMLKNDIIKEKMAKILRSYHFSGDIWAMPEGTIYYPGETLVRITAKLWEINLFTFFLMNAITSNSIFMTKIVRSVLACDNKLVLVTGPVTRAHSNESSLKFGRAAYILGANASFAPSFARKFGIPMSLTNTKAYHAFIKSFPTELEAMRAAASIFPRIGFMVDTYDFKQGMANAIIVAKEQRLKIPNAVSAVVIDSGKDVYEYINRTFYARKELDSAGLKDINIIVTGNFEENKIAAFVKAKAPAYSVIACTDLVTVSDDPKMEAVLKLANYEKDGVTHHTVKLAKGKISYPGKKQVFRYFKNGSMEYDVIGLEDELLGKPLLEHYVKDGKLVRDLPSLDSVKEYAKKQLEELPKHLKRIDRTFKYSVNISPKLKALFESIKKEHISK